MKRLLFLLIFLWSFSNGATTLEKKSLQFTRNNHDLLVSFLLYPEFFYGKNLTFLNNNNPDEILFFRSFIDFTSVYTYKKNDLDYIKAKATIRSRSLWGNQPALLETTEQPIKELDTLFGAHRQGLFLSDFWIRELWIEIALNDLLGLNWCNRHIFTIGAFPFELGRGMTLGSNYPALPPVVGFFIDSSIDQYAFGAKLTGELVKDRFAYDIYATIFSNNAATFDQTNQNVRGHEYGRRFDSARGFGFINYLAAARLKWYLLKNETKQIYVEPYALYSWNPELKIEFLDDAVSNLATFGVMADYVFGSFQWGWEYAFNRGGQDIFGVDRNSTHLEEQQGTVRVTNDQVIDIRTGEDASVTPEHQILIYNSPTGQVQNGKMIRPSLRNKPFRFQDPARIQYSGSFFVLDASYIIKKDMLKVSAAVGIATGDSDPRMRLALLPPGQKRVIDYNGFITINESYAGKRVTSTLFFNGFGAFPRVLTFGIEGVSPTTTVLNATGFTNLIYAGASFDYNYKPNIHTWHLYPNLLFYWQEEPSIRFDSKKRSKIPIFSHIPHFVDRFLGTELNLLAELEALKDLTFFAAGAVFIPGIHFKRLKHRALNDAQSNFLKNKKLPRESLLGNDFAYLLNMGFKYVF